MRLVPEDNTRKVLFFAGHVDNWLEHAEEMGSSEEEILALKAELEAAKWAMNAQREAQAAAQAATSRMNRAIDALAFRGASIIQRVRTRAVTGGNRIYELARIPRPSDPSPLGPPGMPSKLTTQLAAGAMILRWKCKNPRGSTGTMYQISRGIDNGPFSILGMTGEKKFVDDTIPRGCGLLTYRIQAIRSTAVGTAALFPVSMTGSGMHLLTAHTLKPRKATLYATQHNVPQCAA